MQTTIRKWGNSYAVRLPKPIVDRFQLRAGSQVTIREFGKALMVERAVMPEPVGLQDWRKYLIPTGRKQKRNISTRIDEILYGKSRR